MTELSLKDAVRGRYCDCYEDGMKKAIGSACAIGMIYSESNIFKSPLEFDLYLALYEECAYDNFMGTTIIENPVTFQAIEAGVPVGKYVTDMLYTYVRYGTENKSTHKVTIAVEVDGHEFHEKTKQQAARDRERDRFFQSNNILVARFTGSEVHKNAKECALKVQTMAKEHLKSAGA